MNETKTAVSWEQVEVYIALNNTILSNLVIVSIQSVFFLFSLRIKNHNEKEDQVVDSVVYLDTFRSIPTPIS